MSEEQRNENLDSGLEHAFIETGGPLTGDWWHFAGIALAWLETQEIQWRQGALPGREGIYLLTGPIRSPVTRIQISSDQGKTEVIAETQEPAHQAVIEELSKFLMRASQEAEFMRRRWTPSAPSLLFEV